MESWIFENVINENLHNFITTSPNKGFYDPDQSENHREEREEGKGTRARERKTSNSLQQSLVFILVSLEIVFERQKNKVKHTRKLILRAISISKSRYI